MDIASVFEFLDECRLRGEASVLVTVCAVTGSSMRNPGAVMCVAGDGNFQGSLSGGCIENAVVAEALDALKAGAPRIVRFGAGSPYLDIKLPCGGGLDVHFQPLDAENLLAAECVASIRGRAPFSVALGPDGPAHVAKWRERAFDPDTGTAMFGHWPMPKLQIVGHGAGVLALAQLARTHGCSLRVLTPDSAQIAALGGAGIEAVVLRQTGDVDMLQSDPWTASIFLFHDHDWELDLMAEAMARPHFYIGAMGGRKAHAMRTEALKARGVSEAAIASIRAPIGVFHSSRDPQTLALSTLAEVVRAYHEADFGEHCG